MSDSGKEKYSVGYLQERGKVCIEKIVRYMLNEMDVSFFNIEEEECEMIFEEEINVKKMLELIRMHERIDIDVFIEKYACGNVDLIVKMIESVRSDNAALCVEVWGINVLLESRSRNWEGWRKKAKGTQILMDNIDKLVEVDCHNIPLDDGLLVYYDRLIHVRRIKEAGVGSATNAVAAMFRTKDSNGKVKAIPLPFDCCGRTNFCKWIANLPDAVRDEHDSHCEDYFEMFTETFKDEVCEMKTREDLADWICGKKTGLVQHKVVEKIMKTVMEVEENRIILKQEKMFKMPLKRGEVDKVPLKTKKKKEECE